MKKINFSMLFLATLIVLMFCLVGVSIFYENLLLGLLFLFLGFSLMAFGLVLKRRKSDV